MLVSVIIPTFNRANKVLGAIDSALTQTYQPLEVIVVDDGSTDATMAALDSLSGRIKVIQQANAGPSAARNCGVAAANGEMIAFLDSDDHWKPDKIERQVALMGRAGSRMCCCVCNATIMGGNGEFLGHSFEIAGIKFDFNEGEWTNPQDVLATRFLLFNQVVAIRREAFERVGGFNVDLRILEDYELALRLSTVGSWGIIRDSLVIKYNDTCGIGVECMMNRKRHAQVRVDVITGILESQHGLAPLASGYLRRTLDDVKTELRALALVEHGGIPSRLAGQTLEFWLRARRSFRRHSPAWPKCEGRCHGLSQAHQ